MSAISLKSITGITSITTPAGVDNQLTLHSNNTVERLRITSDGNVGVNTSSVSIAGMSRYLSVSARNVTNGGAAVELVGARTGSDQTLGVINFVNQTSKVAEIRSKYQGSTTLGSLHFQTSGTERLQITSTGDLSLRTTTQNAYLGLTANSTAINTTLGSTAGTSPRLYLKGTGNGQSDAGDVFIGAGTGGIVNIRSAELMKFEVNSDSSLIEALRIKSDGNVDIGGGTHNRRLSVHDTTNSVIIIEGASNGTSSLFFGDESDEDVGAFTYNHASNYLACTVNTQERLRINSTGITTITSSSNEEIFRIQTSFGNPGNTQGKALMGFDHFSVSEKPAILIGSEEEGNSSHKGSFVIKLKDAAATDDDPVERFRIAANGKVLVGDGSSITPSRNLDVRGSGHQQILLGSTNNQGASLMVDGAGGGDGSGGDYCTFEAASDGHLKIRNYDADKNIIFGTGSATGSADVVIIDSSGRLLVNKTSTSDYGKFEVKGGTADNIETADITAKTIATFSGSTPGTTAAGKGAGIVIKPISNRGCNYFIGVANDSTNQEAHGRFIIRSGNQAGTTSERLRIDSSGHITPGTDNSQHIGNGTTNFNSIWASTRFRGNDNVKLVLGNSQDLVVRHDGTNNLIESPQGHNLFIKSGTGDNANLKQIQCNHGGSVVLYYNDSARVTTTSDGITFGGEVTFSSGQNVRTFAGAVYLTDGQHADIVTHNGGYAWAFFEFYGISYHGSIGRCRWHGSMSRYGNEDNYPTINNSMSYWDVQRVTDSNNANRRSIRLQRTGTYGGVWCNFYVRCYAANSTAGWDAGTGATKKYQGN